MRFLIAAAIAQAVLYGVIARLSNSFAYGSSEAERPVLLMLGVFAAIFVLYFTSIRVAVNCPPSRRLVWIIAAAAIVFRGLLLPTHLIQEVDIYRYLWDGAVTAHGLNPYRYSPAQILSADRQEDLGNELRSLVELRDSSPVTNEVLRRVHFPELTTIYPPTSQAVLALGDLLSPRSASVQGRVVILKTLLTIFDLGTMALVWLLLKAASKHPGWLTAYAWCPLVMKEFANTGHLDSIAVFLTTASLVSFGRCFLDHGGRASFFDVLKCAILISLAIGAKLYPIVLVPLFAASIAAKVRPYQAVLFVMFTACFSGAILAPMILTIPAVSNHVDANAFSMVDSLPENSSESSLPPRAKATPATTGLSEYLTSWEMNDFLFMLVVENLQSGGPSVGPKPWFAIVPRAWTEATIQTISSALEVDGKTAAFVVARIMSIIIFLAIALLLAWRVYRNADTGSFMEAAFLTLAWFLLLSPAQFPWYWSWTLPLVAFTRGRAWFVMSALIMVYYLRFWFQYQLPDGPLLDTPYDGPQFYDFVVTWLVFMPWFLWLTISAIHRIFRERS